MATEIHKDLIRLLARLPDIHSHREFLEIELQNVRRFIFEQGEQVGDQVAEAKEKIKILVDKDIGDHPLVPEMLRENERTIVKGQHLHGEEFVGNLLPPECRQFGAILNLLRKQNIETKRQLIGLPDVKKLIGVAGKRAQFIGAMQDLAIAEIIQAPQKGQK